LDLVPETGNLMCRYSCRSGNHEPEEDCFFG
jgi:hypothetical protein